MLMVSGPSGICTIIVEAFTLLTCPVNWRLPGIAVVGVGVDIITVPPLTDDTVEVSVVVMGTPAHALASTGSRNIPIPTTRHR
jgi:hypothetical protein